MMNNDSCLQSTGALCLYPLGKLAIFLTVEHCQRMRKTLPNSQTQSEFWGDRNAVRSHSILNYNQSITSDLLVGSESRRHQQIQK